MEVDAATLQVLGAAVVAITTAIGGTASWFVRSMWKGRQEEVERLREHQQKEVERLRERVADLERQAEVRVQRLEADIAERKKALQSLEDEAREIHRKLREPREARGDPPRDDDLEAHIGAHLGKIVRERQRTTEAAPDRVKGPSDKE